jgi:xylulokinase
VSDSRPGADEDRLLLGCDVGTSAVKTVLMTAGGDLLARRSAEHAMHHPRPGWAENNPDDWYQGLAHTIRGVLRDAEVPPERVAAISVVAQREPVVLVDVQGAALCPAISWTDRRTGAEAREVADRFGRSWLIAKTGMVPVAGASLPQMLWLRRHRQDDWRRAHKILLAKDYVVSRLTGELTTDVSTPGRSLMLDIGQGEWCSEICDAFEIDRERLAAIVTAPWEQIGELTATAAEQLGLAPGTPVATGGADDAAATLGAGAIEPGEACIGTGTATNWRRVLDQPRTDPSGRGDVAPHVVAERYIYEVAIESTGSSLRWLHDTFAPDRSFDELIEEASRLPPGAEGLVFYPFLDGGARAPHYLENATGAALGIVSGHGVGHMVRALLEGVAYQYPATMEIAARGSTIRAPIATGDGEARNPFWNQLKADVLGVSLRIPRVIELAAAGSALLGGLCAGFFATAAEGVRALVPVLIAGGPKAETHREVLQMVRGAMDAGAAGIAMGRKVWQSSDPPGMVRALAAIIRDGASVDDALEHLTPLPAA